MTVIGSLAKETKSVFCAYMCLEEGDDLQGSESVACRPYVYLHLGRDPREVTKDGKVREVTNFVQIMGVTNKSDQVTSNLH